MRWFGFFGKRREQVDVAGLKIVAAADQSAAAPQTHEETPAPQDCAPRELLEDSAPVTAEPAAAEPAAAKPAKMPTLMPMPTPPEPSKLDTLLMGLTTAAQCAGPALSAQTLSVLDNTPLPPPPPPPHQVVLDPLVKSLLEEVRSRADLAVGAYDKLSAEVRQHAQVWRKSARRASWLASTMTALLLVGGIWSAYTLGRQNTLVQGFEQQVAQTQALALDRDHLRTELSAANAEQFQSLMQLHAVQSETVKTQMELKLCQEKLETARQARAVQNPTPPATQPAAMLLWPDTWAVLVGQ